MMNMRPSILVASGAALHLMAWGEPVPACGPDPDQAVRECLIQAPRAGAQRECRSELNLEQAFLQTRLKAGVDYASAMASAQELSAMHGLSFRVLFRPALPDGHGILMAMNPHQRSDVTVCKSHQVELYVGRAPFRAMPGQSLVGFTLAEAQSKLVAAQREQGGPDPLICWLGTVQSGESPRVEAQWPLAGALLGKAVPLARFEMPEQRPVLVVRPALKAPEVCRPCDGCVTLAPPESPPSEEGGAGDAAAGAAAGLGAGFALARLLGGGGSNESGGSRRPGGGTAPLLPRTRVRPDLDIDDLSERKDLSNAQPCP